MGSRDDDFLRLIHQPGASRQVPVRVAPAIDPPPDPQDPEVLSREAWSNLGSEIVLDRFQAVLRDT